MLPIALHLQVVSLDLSRMVHSAPLLVHVQRRVVHLDCQVMHTSLRAQLDRRVRKGNDHRPIDMKYLDRECRDRVL